MDPITESLRKHYAEKFSAHGPTSQGVDWGSDESRMLLRFNKMLAVLEKPLAGKPSLLDVGCGYGGLLKYVQALKIDLDYSGIDVAENMVKWASENLKSGRFYCGDVLDYDLGSTFDYVVCSGVKGR